MRAGPMRDPSSTGSGSLGDLPMTAKHKTLPPPVDPHSTSEPWKASFSAEADSKPKIGQTSADLAQEVHMPVNVRRLPIQLLPDASRVIIRYFGLGEENRIRDVVRRILAIPETTVAALVANLERDFQPIHPDIDEVFREHFEAVKYQIPIEG